VGKVGIRELGLRRFRRLVDNTTLNSIEVILYLNPVTDFATLDFSIEQNTNLSSKLCTSESQFVKSFFEDWMQTSGNHKEVFFVGDVASGIYLQKVGKRALSVIHTPN
jgi:hypothetical protein